MRMGEVKRLTAARAVGRCAFYDPPLLHHDDVIAALVHSVEIVRHENKPIAARLLFP